MAAIILESKKATVENQETAFLPIHHVIQEPLSDQDSLRKIQEMIKRSREAILEERDPTQLNATPLIAAVTARKIDLALYLISLKADLTATDAQGCNFLHRAIFIDDGGEALKLLVEKVREVSPKALAQLKDMKNIYQGTYEDLARIVYPVEENSEEIIGELEKKDGSRERLTRARFKELTGVKFSNSYTATSQTLAELYKRNPPYIDREATCSTFAKLVLCEEPQGGYGVKAGPDPLNSNEYIGLYTGSLISDYTKTPASNRSLTRRLQCVDPSQWSNLGSFFNDGPPNCVFALDMLYRNGIPLQVPVLASLSNIAAGEKLFVDYGPSHPIKKGRYHLSKEELNKVRIFVQKCPLTMLEQKADLDIEITTMYAYILSTPYVLWHLFLEEEIKVEDMSKLLKNGTLAKFCQRHFPRASHQEAGVQLLQDIEDLCKNIEKIQTYDNRHEIASSLLGMFKEFSVFWVDSIISGFTTVTSGVTKDTLEHAKNFLRFMTVIDSFCSEDAEVSVFIDQFNFGELKNKALTTREKRLLLERYRDSFSYRRSIQDGLKFFIEQVETHPPKEKWDQLKGLLEMLQQLDQQAEEEAQGSPLEKSESGEAGPAPSTDIAVAKAVSD